MVTNTVQTFSLFPEFPVEIQRLIFEEAFEDSCRKATHIALVSRQVRSWIEPLIYQCISLNYRTYTKNTRQQLHQFASTFRDGSKPRDFYATFVSRVFIDDLRQAKLAEEFLPLCSNLTSLACWATPNSRTESILESIFSPHALPLPRLRRLSIYWESLPLGYRTFQHPMFKNLTHLDIDFGFATPWDGLSLLENLSHFNLDCILSCTKQRSLQAIAIHLESTIHTILPHLPLDLRCFIVLIPCTVIEQIVTEKLDETDVARQFYTGVVLGKHDERIVLGSSGGISQSLSAFRETRQDLVHYIVPVPYDLYAWTYLPRGHADFWMEAEDVILTRKRDRIRSSQKGETAQSFRV